MCGYPPCLPCLIAATRNSAFNGFGAPCSPNAAEMVSETAGTANEITNCAICKKCVSYDNLSEWSMFAYFSNRLLFIDVNASPCRRSEHGSISPPPSRTVAGHVRPNTAMMAGCAFRICLVYCFLWVGFATNFAVQVRSWLAEKGLASTEGLASCTKFCGEHVQAESLHLALMEALLDGPQRTALVPLWRLSGFYLGFVPTVLLGPRGLYATVEPVETFVVGHYEEQYGPLEEQGLAPKLCAALRVCCADEAHHRDDAAERAGPPGSLLRSAWAAVVRGGSAGAAHVARLV